ncbi:Cell division control 1 [Lecanosticta acicola]|uniref:Cell division control 1 n=1 Tax=Lecanosticta acicola TaxID=111012 RepID=A0AAI8Z1K3_9PEZI|nr:Cell division control 1 [Lecanosticta acicola]
MTMRYRHVISKTARRTTRRYPFLRHASITTIVLILVWIYAVYSGERSTYESHIRACHWDKWEEWPREARPHHSVFVADPQLVDPHTYPGRPWPLSSLTEKYTDLYMSRNFRLINQQLDPDSVVFLGDLFDGGREWATSKARYLKASQRDTLVKLAILGEGEKEGQRESLTNVDFVQGENGRWAKWGGRQWNADFDRFGRIFFDAAQLYPGSEVDLLPAYDVPVDPISMENGAKNVTWTQYGVTSRKYRRVMTSLPGNHDLGFGSGVQLPVRDRFRSHFGATNNVYVLGNHTFVSVDSPSYSAFDEYVPGGEVSAERRNQYYKTWKPTSDFLDDLERKAPKVVAETMNEYFPGSHPIKGFRHEAINANESQPEPRDVSDVPKDKPILPVVLLTHVPLFRNPDTDCGRLREKGKAIAVARGYQYQNVLTPTLSNAIVKKVSTAGDIMHVFSGDDHDYCDVTHRFNVGRWNEEEQKDKVEMRTMREVTVKSFSWAMGVRRPGFLLVSLWNPVDEMGNTVGTPLPTIETQLCLLPDQLSIFINYAILLGWTLLILVIRAGLKAARNRQSIDEEDSEDDMVGSRLTLPRYQSRFIGKQDSKTNGYANGHSSANGDAKGRQRASSTSMSTSNGNNNNTLGVQRSFNARTRSVSPAAAVTASNNYNPNTNEYGLPNLQEHSGPLIERAGYYPPVKWQDPNESDEESHLGDDEQDSQAKWKKRRRPRSKARIALDEFIASVAFVAIPSGLFYGFLIRNG